MGVRIATALYEDFRLDEIEMRRSDGRCGARDVSDDGCSAHSSLTGVCSCATAGIGNSGGAPINPLERNTAIRQRAVSPEYAVPAAHFVGNAIGDPFCTPGASL